MQPIKKISASGIKSISWDSLKPGYRNLWIVLACLILASVSWQCDRGAGQNIKIGINSWSGYDPFIIAEKAGIFQKQGLNAKIVRFASAKEEMVAFQNGLIQGACLTLDEVFALVSAGYSLKIILAIDFSMGGDMILGQPDIKDMSQLEGKRVGFEGSVVGEFLLNRALLINSMKGSEMKLTSVPSDQWLSAFKLKTVDALVCYNPVASNLIDQDGANVLFTSASIPFEIIDVLIISEPFYNDHKELLVKTVKSWFDALEFQKKNHQEAIKIITAEKKTDVNNYESSLKGLFAPDLTANLLVFNPDSEKNIFKYSQPIINFMISQRLLNERITTNGLFVQDILEAAGQK